LKIYKDFYSILDLHPLLNTMTTRFDFDAQFEVIMHDREGWAHVTIEQGVFIYYTDDSRNDGLLSIGVDSPSIRHCQEM
jgi:hypothetical protein